MAAPKNDESGIRQTIRALKRAGWDVFAVNNGGEDDEPVNTESEAIEEATASDEAYLYVRERAGGPGGDTAFVRFVLGNMPYEVICDYSINLDKVLTPLIDGWQPED